MDRAIPSSALSPGRSDAAAGIAATAAASALLPPNVRRAILASGHFEWVDGQRLAELMIEHGIGVAEEHAYHVKKIDSDYFEEG